jgi:hypothetical protein
MSRTNECGVGCLAILENEAGAGMGNESVPHFMEEIVSILFRLVGDLVGLGALKRLKGTCP